MANQSDQTQTERTKTSKYQCVVVELDNKHIVSTPGDVFDFDINVISLPPSLPSACVRYKGHSYITVGGVNFSNLEAFHDSVREEIKGLEGKLSEGEQLSLTRIRQHLAQKPEYVVLGNYKPLPSQLM